jgi:hypothetical protein
MYNNDIMYLYLLPVYSVIQNIDIRNIHTITSVYFIINILSIL